MAADVDIGPLSQGHSYTTVLRYESEPIVRIPISAITCPIGAARIATTTPHGMLDGWRGTVVNVQQPKEINAEDPNNIRSSEYHSATVIDTSTVEFNDFNIAYAELCGVAGDVYPITASTRDELDEIKPGWRKTTERPEYFVHDDKTLLLGAIPDADYTLTLEFFRVPRKKMTQDTDAPEIHSAHHEGLIQWVLHKAYAKPDGDLFDPGKSASAEAEFTRQFGKRPTADLRRRQNANRPHRNRVHL